MIIEVSLKILVWIWQRNSNWRENSIFLKLRNHIKTPLVPIIWVKVFKNGPKKICGRQPLKNMKWYQFKYFEGCLAEILFGPFWNIFTHTCPLDSVSLSVILLCKFGNSLLSCYVNLIKITFVKKLQFWRKYRLFSR